MLLVLQLSDKRQSIQTIIKPAKSMSAHRRTVTSSRHIFQRQFMQITPQLYPLRMTATFIFPFFSSHSLILYRQSPSQQSLSPHQLNDSYKRPQKHCDLRAHIFCTLDQADSSLLHPINPSHHISNSTSVIICNKYVGIDVAMQPASRKTIQLTTEVKEKENTSHCAI